MRPFKKAHKPRVTLTRGGRTIYDGEVYDIPLRDDVVIAKSIEFFDDPTPCYIHKGAVMARLYGEIALALPEGGNAASALEFDALPAHIQAYMDV